MKIVMLYHPGSEQAGPVEDYAREYHMRHPQYNLELLDVDSPQGSQMATNYDITNYPAVLALRDDGGFLQLWQDEHLPIMNELDAYQ